MTVSVAQMITDIGYAVDDPNNRRFTTTQLLTYINEAQTDIARRAEIIEWQATIQVYAQQRDYMAPLDTVRIYRVEYLQTSGTQIWPLEYFGLNEMDAVWGIWQFNASAYPSVYTMFQAPPLLMVRLYPVPGVSGSINVYYYRLPHIVGLNDNIDLPFGWEDLVRDYSEFLCKRADHDPDATQAKQIYEMKLTAMIDKTRHYADAPRRMSEGFNPYPWMSYGELS